MRKKCIFQSQNEEVLVDKEQISAAEINDVLVKWKEVQNVDMKWNPNKFVII